MSCYYQNRRQMLVIRCDACGRTEDIEERQTDRMLKHEWMREHGWKCVRASGKWLDLCPACKTALEEKRRQTFIAGI